ncbi:MAG: glycosyltransferase family 4 protein [Pseudonocardia sp.]|nr:glycosyltransferase family 4 protein [Pseudonocardia sp.]
MSFAAGGDVSELAGPASPVAALAAAQVKDGHEVVLIARRQTGSSAWFHNTAFEVREVPGGPPTELADVDAISHIGEFVRGLGREIRAGGFDMVHSHGWLAGLAVQLASPAPPLPVVHTSHRPQLVNRLETAAGGPRQYRINAERAVAMRADHIVATSEVERDSLLRVGLTRGVITVVPPGVHTELADNASTTETRWRQHRLLVFGSTSRTLDTVRALRLLPDAELIICGRPDEPIEPQADSIIDLATALDLSQRVHLDHRISQRVHLDHRITVYERAPLIRSADVVLCLSPPGQAGTTHLEAMAQGIPVVAGNPEAAEAVVNGITGVHAIDPTARFQAATLRTLLANATLRQTMGIAGYDRAIARYSWNRIAAETLRVYERLIQHPRNHPGPGRAASASGLTAHRRSTTSSTPSVVHLPYRSSQECPTAGITWIS